MPRIAKSKSTPKSYIWRVNPDKSPTKFSHKKYDGAGKKGFRKI